MIEKYDGFIFDLDGTIYRGEHLIPNADKTVNSLMADNVAILLDMRFASLYVRF